MSTLVTKKIVNTLNSLFRFEQNWFFPQTKEVVFLFTQIVGFQFIPNLFKLNLNTLEYTQIFPLSQEDINNVGIALNNIRVASITRGTITYNSTIKKYLLTYTGLDNNPGGHQPFIINFKLTDWDLPRLESIDIYKDTVSYRNTKIPPLVLDVNNNLVFTNVPSNTNVTVYIPILNNPTSCQIVSDPTGNATITNDGYMTVNITTGSGIYHVNFSATNNFGTSYYDATFIVY